MVIELFQDLFRKHRRIPAAVLKVKIQRVLGQSFASRVIILYIFAGNSDKTVFL